MTSETIVTDPHICPTPCPADDHWWHPLPAPVVAGVIPVLYSCGHERQHTYLSRADLETYKRWSRGVCPSCVPRTTPSEAARRMEV